MSNSSDINVLQPRHDHDIAIVPAADDTVFARPRAFLLKISSARSKLCKNETPAPRKKSSTILFFHGQAAISLEEI